jgi:hypothetical protein
MPSYYKPLEKREISNVTLIINTTRSKEAKEQDTNFKGPAHDHIDNEFHCSSISNITKVKSRLH